MWLPSTHLFFPQGSSHHSKVNSTTIHPAAQAKILGLLLNFSFSHTPYPIVQKILLALSSEYTWKLMFIHHFLHYNCCPSNNLLIGHPDFNLFNPVARISVWEQRIMFSLTYNSNGFSLYQKSLLCPTESHTLWPLPASPTSVFQSLPHSLCPSHMGLLAISQTDGACSCLRVFALAGLLPTCKHLRGSLPHFIQASVQILLT